MYPSLQGHCFSSAADKSMKCFICFKNVFRRVKSTERAIRVGRPETFMLGPVYSGKCIAGALALAGNRPSGENVLFFHTGGTPAIFAYANSLDGVISA